MEPRLDLRPQVLFIPGPLPGLNDLLDWAKIRRGSWSRYQTKARQWHERIVALARAQRIEPMGRVVITFTWIEPSLRRDPDNVTAGAKFILDGIVQAKLLQNDSRRFIMGINHEWGSSKSCPGVIVTLYPTQESTE